MQPTIKIDYRNAALQPIPMSQINSEFYGGAIVNVSLSVRPYSAGGNVGFTTYLSGIQKVADSEPFGADRSDFDEVDTSGYDLSEMAVAEE